MTPRIALALLLLATGSAGAAEVKPGTCPLVGATITLVQPYKNSEPHVLYVPAKTQAYEGQTFIVTRATRVKRIVQRDGTLLRSYAEVEPGLDARTLGYEAIRITGKAGTFVIRTDWNWGTPAMLTDSQRTGKGIRWGRRDSGPMRVGPTEEGEINHGFSSDFITSGPLTGYEIAGFACPDRAAR